MPREVARSSPLEAKGSTRTLGPARDRPGSPPVGGYSYAARGPPAGASSLRSARGPRTGREQERSKASRKNPDRELHDAFGITRTAPSSHHAPGVRHHLVLLGEGALGRHFQIDELEHGPGQEVDPTLVSDPRGRGRGRCVARLGPLNPACSPVLVRGHAHEPHLGPALRRAEPGPDLLSSVRSAREHLETEAVIRRAAVRRPSPASRQGVDDAIEGHVSSMARSQRQRQGLEAHLCRLGRPIFCGPPR